MAIAGAAHAETLPLKATGAGQVTDESFAFDPILGPGIVQEYVAAGNSTLLGKYEMEGMTFFYDFNEFGLPTQAVGELTFTAADGATIFCTYTGTSQLEGITFRFELDGLLGPGTGRLSGVTGGGRGTVFQTDPRLVDPSIEDLPAFDFTIAGEWILP
jgi:hypothetical protein